MREAKALMTMNTICRINRARRHDHREEKKSIYSKRFVVGKLLELLMLSSMSARIAQHPAASWGDADGSHSGIVSFAFTRRHIKRHTRSRSPLSARRPVGFCSLAPLLNSQHLHLNRWLIIISTVFEFCISLHVVPSTHRRRRPSSILQLTTMPSREFREMDIRSSRR